MFNMILNTFCTWYAADIYLLKVNNRNTRKYVWNMFNTNNKDAIGVNLLLTLNFEISLLLTLNIFQTFF